MKLLLICCFILPFGYFCSLNILLFFSSLTSFVLLTSSFNFTLLFLLFVLLLIFLVNKLFGNLNDGILNMCPVHLTRCVLTTTIMLGSLNIRQFLISTPSPYATCISRKIFLNFFLSHISSNFCSAILRLYLLCL